MTIFRFAVTITTPWHCVYIQRKCRKTKTKLLFHFIKKRFFLKYLRSTPGKGWRFAIKNVLFFLNNLYSFFYVKGKLPVSAPSYLWIQHVGVNTRQWKLRNSSYLSVTAHAFSELIFFVFRFVNENVMWKNGKTKCDEL